MTSELPVHFFTIVLNGEPFIEYHLDIFKSLPFEWHWHVVEGVADLKHDTAWSVQAGGRISDEVHRHGRSIDGTTEYLDRVARECPAQVTVYRKPPGVFWDGKREMVSAPLPNINEECLLWQIDADELWRAGQVVAMRKEFLEHPGATAAFFWCDYFVGPTAVISTRDTYSNHSAWEWLRVWRFKPGDRWLAHEPPRLLRRRWYGLRSDDVACIAPIMHARTEQLGLVFQHFAYVTEAQLRFKETYYGYSGAVRSWQKLQEALQSSTGPLMVRDYLPWVTDEAEVDLAARQNVTPIAVYDPTTSRWRFDR